MRIRSFKPDLFTSEDIAALSFQARWTFLGLIAYVDDGGKGRADLRLIKAAIYPLDDDVTAQEIALWMEELGKRDIICEYQVGDTEYFHVVNFRLHQKINRPTASKMIDCFKEVHGLRKNGDRYLQTGDGTIVTLPNKTGHPSSLMSSIPSSDHLHGALTEPSVSVHGGLTTGKGTGNREQGEGNGLTAERTADAVRAAKPASGPNGVPPATLPGIDPPQTAPKRDGAGALIAHWMELLRGHRPHHRTISSIGKYLKGELDRGIPEDLLRESIDELVRSGKSGVNVLRSMVDDAITRKAGTPDLGPKCPDHRSQYQFNCPYHDEEPQ